MDFYKKSGSPRVLFDFLPKTGEMARQTAPHGLSSCDTTGDKRDAGFETHAALAFALPRSNHRGVLQEA